MDRIKNDDGALTFLEPGELKDGDRSLKIATGHTCYLRQIKADKFFESLKS